MVKVLGWIIRLLKEPILQHREFIWENQLTNTLTDMTVAEEEEEAVADAEEEEEIETIIIVGRATAIVVPRLLITAVAAAEDVTLDQGATHHVVTKNFLDVLRFGLWSFFRFNVLSLVIKLINSFIS